MMSRPIDRTVLMEELVGMLEHKKAREGGDAMIEAAKGAGKGNGDGTYGGEYAMRGKNEDQRRGKA